MTETSPASPTTHYRICPLCEACCGLEIKVSEGRVSRISGHAGDPFSQGYICPKGAALKDLHEDPDRLRQPMIKREGRFEPVSWEEAYTEIEQGLQAVQARHGRHSVAAVAGNPSAHKIGLMLYYPRLLKALGTRNIFSAATLDQMPRHVVSGLMYGHWMSVPVPDITRTDWSPNVSVCRWGECRATRQNFPVHRPGRRVHRDGCAARVDCGASALLLSSMASHCPTQRGKPQAKRSTLRGAQGR